MLKQDKPTKRRKHKNSKFGCPNCKKRRVKCSEDLPSCLNCIKHKARCGYLDYTDEQLYELRAAKAGMNVDGSNLTSGKSDLADINLKDLSLSRHESRGSFSSSKKSPQSNIGDSSGSGDSPDSKLGQDVEQSGQPNDSLPAHEEDGSLNLPQTDFSSLKHFSLDPGVDDVFNFQAQHVTQDFDNIMNAEILEGHPIIYPVYSIQNSASISRNLSATPANTSFRPTKDAFNDHSFIPPENRSLAVEVELNQLPNSYVVKASFSRIPHPQVNYHTALFQLVARLGPSIANGTCPLPDIRQLFYIWLNFFISMSTKSETMFSCLLNLTTNYLISNCLNPNQEPTHSFGELVAKTKLNNSLIIVSIKHYAKVIKDLRDLLNKNEDPEMCSTVSYILSLMAIYDPEATLHSINCFRDGLISVLSYNLNMAKNSTKTNKFSLIPVHLRLMINIQRSVYHPSYDPTFLHEFRNSYLRFGEIIHVLDPNASFTHKYGELRSFIDLILDQTIEKIFNTYDDVEQQQEVLFEVMKKWAVTYPIRLLVVSASSTPLEKILSLFYKAFKKALYSIFPQVKYFFLRDFDSPLMLDVLITRSDFDIFESEIDHPVNYGCDPQLYEIYRDELKKLTSYLIRLVSFFQKRITIVYRMTVHEDSTTQFPITDVRKWRALIKNIATVRLEFAEGLGIQEVPIRSFADTILKPYHYPRRSTEEGPSTEFSELIDFLTLKPNCLLEGDYDPFLTA